jgi:periplasmic divalent cation tolerance protein
VTHVQIQFAIDDPDRADDIVEALLTSRLVACGQRTGPVRSRYRWQGGLEGAEEWLVLLKTRADLSGSVIEAVVAAHPYDTPEVVATTLVGGAPGYLAWIDEVTVERPA